MAIDSVRLLTDSAAQLWVRLLPYGGVETLPTSICFEQWMRSTSLQQPLDCIQEQAVRRDYRRLADILTEIETLVHSRDRAIELVCERIAQESP